MSFKSVLRLQQTLRILRKDCAWTRAQTPQSISHFTVEEAYELQEAIAGDDSNHISQELADLLYHLVFYVELYPDLNLEKVAEIANQKLIDRHPEVFDPHYQMPIGSLGDHWQKIKQQERANASLLSEIATSLPALTQAQKIQERVRIVGFDWENPQQVFEQLQSEVAEVDEALAHKQVSDVLEEVGDVMFCCVNLIRHLGGNAETVMRNSNAKFRQRFEKMEEIAQPSGLGEFSPWALEALWKQAKKQLNSGSCDND